MNKLLLLGNGFDVAHKQKTKYTDFKDYLINRIFDQIKSVDARLVVKGLPIDMYVSNNPKRVAILNKKNEVNDFICLEHDGEYNQFGLSGMENWSLSTNRESYFLKELFQDKNGDNEWKDLERLYFEMLRKHHRIENDIKIINKEFATIKEYLIEYLKKIESEVATKPYLRSPIEHIIKSDFQSKFKQHFCVSFNYTKSILSRYWVKNEPSFLSNLPLSPPIFIHGELSNEDNPPIFGYGDDTSEDYKLFQNSPNGEHFLKFFKTFEYARTTNLHTLFGYLESAPFFVQVIGHSLAECDKTLLNSIFTHNNCSKIELCYRNDSNNYFKKLYQLAKIIDDNSKLRERIVPLECTSRIDEDTELQQGIIEREKFLESIL